MNIVEFVILGVLLVDILMNARTQNRLKWIANRIAAEASIRAE